MSLEFESFPCGHCGKMVETEWCSDGLLPGPYTLLGDVVFHDACVEDYLKPLETLTMATDPISLLTPHLPAIRAAAAVEYDETGPAHMVLSNYDLWLKMRNDPQAAAYARGVQFAFDKWMKANEEKLK